MEQALDLFGRMGRFGLGSLPTTRLRNHLSQKPAQLFDRKAPWTVGVFGITGIAHSPNWVAAPARADTPREKKIGESARLSPNSRSNPFWTSAAAICAGLTKRFPASAATQDTISR